MGIKLLILATALLQAGSGQIPIQDVNTASERGRKIFVARCAKCHNEDMKKKASRRQQSFRAAQGEH
jgi:cytochrome c